MIWRFQLRWYHFYWGTLIGMVFLVWLIALSPRSQKPSSVVEKLERAGSEEEVVETIGFSGELIGENPATGAYTKQWGKDGDEIHVLASWDKDGLLNMSVSWRESVSVLESIKRLVAGRGFRASISKRRGNWEKERMAE